MPKSAGLVACLLSILAILLYAGGISSEKTRSSFTTASENEAIVDLATFASQLGESDPKEANNHNFINSKTERYQTQRVPDGCSLVLADSSIADAGWGVFTLKTLNKGDTVASGDPVIQIPDPNPHQAQGMRRIIWDYLWDSQETGGQYEGQRVMSMVPGIGMVANGESNLHNVLPYKPELDDAGLTRNHSPGAGAFTHYQNFTWYTHKTIEAGGEIFVNYGEGWFRERGYFNQPTPSEKRTLPWLMENGYCIDNLVPGRSTIAHAGRGAFASRDLDNGSIVAPIPVLPLSSASLGMIKQHKSGHLVLSEQLLRNYCFGHNKSSLLFFPYSPGVNLINHDSEPNVELRWAETSIPMFSKPIATLHLPSTRLLLELVALRPIKEGEEILLDYGSEWVTMWEKHVSSWRQEFHDPLHSRADFVSSQTMDKVVSILRTETELRADPYPENVFTSCYYKYANQSAKNAAKRTSSSPVKNKPDIVFWKHSEGLLETQNLRPCSILQRDQGADGKHLYTVRMLNRPGLAETERIPKGVPHIVASVPREAIRFSDKLYTTDQHLETAFRKEIGLRHFPPQWMDL